MSANMVQRFVVRQNDQLRLNERQRRIYEFLQSHPIGVLSTIDPNGNPHGVVLYFSIDEHFAIRFITKAKTKKSDNLRHNHHSMLTVFDAETQSTAQVIATATEITDTTAVDRMATALLARCLSKEKIGLPPIAKLDAGEYTMFQLNPIQIRLARYGAASAGTYDQLFESIESFDLNTGY